MAAQHSPAAVEFIAAFPFSLVVDVRELGPVRFCHGSPRSVGPDVHLRQSSYDVGEAVRRGVAVGDPSADVIERMLRQPPTPDQIIADAESLVFSD
jgi:hypothetical protein